MSLLHKSNCFALLIQAHTKNLFKSICIAFHRISTSDWVEKKQQQQQQHYQLGSHFKTKRNEKTLSKAPFFYCIRFASDAQINSIYYTPWPNILIQTATVFAFVTIEISRSNQIDIYTFWGHLNHNNIQFWN